MVGIADQPLIPGIDDEIEQFQWEIADEDRGVISESETSMTQSRPRTVSFTGL